MHPALSPAHVAVITGAAAGIGYAIAERCAEAGMHLTLLDSDAASLNKACHRMRERRPGITVRGVIGDVSDPVALDQLIRQAFALGPVTFLSNNAATLRKAGPCDSAEDWRGLLDINLMPMIHLQHAIVPRMLDQGLAAAVVNVGSKEGITTPPGNAAYSVAKAGVRVLTEHLAHELRQIEENPVSAFLLIPGYTFTPMNFPGMTDETTKPAAPWTTGQVVDRLMEDMEAGRFYVFCEDNEVTPELDRRRMRWSMDDLIFRRPPLSRWHPDYGEEFADFVKGA
jgi:Dehydrogenases with different specificities (related to short-chain alcohol dehydrogenases)